MAELPYGGDMMAAVRAQDRDAIRVLLERNQQNAAAPVQPEAATLADEEFACPICTELLYKPCVNACGHTFCFWCLHKAMDPLAASSCPLCRSGFKQCAAAT